MILTFPFFDLLDQVCDFYKCSDRFSLANFNVNRVMSIHASCSSLTSAVLNKMCRENITLKARYDLYCVESAVKPTSSYEPDVKSV